jgi:cation transport regulator ChaC
VTTMPSTERNFIFGYGSLVARAGSAEDSAVACHLEGFRRGWNVAMDNTVTIPSYKYYVDEGTGERPEVYVSFLNIWPGAGSRVNGVAYEVDEEILALLDLRERNYDRHEVTAQIELEVPGRVWAYVGQAQARERYEAGRAKANAVVCEEYYRAVRGTFARFEPAMLDEFDRTTDHLDVPRRALTRIDLPETGNGTRRGPQAPPADRPLRRPPATSS